MSVMTPRETVQELDKHIIGQDEAKKAVSIALRNRWRRANVVADLRPEITPKNILMIGPTGVGKTEIARRLAKLANAPFLKVEATKFTEVGYVGRDVDSIIRDLVDVSIKMHKEQAMKKLRPRAEDAAEERILDVLLPAPTAGSSEGQDMSDTRQKFRKKLREGQLDDKEITLDLAVPPKQVEIMGPPGMDDLTDQLQSAFAGLGMGKTQSRKLKIKDAQKLLIDEEAAKLINEDDLKAEALDNVENNGIVFLDEIDKVAKSNSQSSGDVSREGVQRDLLPLIEGSSISTKHGTVKTDHILFIASGAFHYARPSDLIAELQGRLPIRVELKALRVEDFVRILTEPKASLITQYIALMKTEGLNLDFDQAAIQRIAEIAHDVNETTENIGARRLHTVMEKLLEDLSFDASDKSDETVTVTAEYVNEKLGDLAQNTDMSRYIL